MAHKTTKEDFDLFKSTICGLTFLLNQKGWVTKFLHEKLDEGDFGDCDLSLPDKYATIRLTSEHRDKLTENIIIDVATHEALERFILPLQIAARDPATPEHQLDYIRHEIIHVIQYCLLAAIPK